MVKVEPVSSDIAEKLCRDITKDLPEYFGLPEVNGYYAAGVRSCVNLAARLESRYVGLISIDFPYPNNSNIYWLALFKEFHSQNIGSKLIEYACALAARDNATTITVETLATSEMDENYLKTYKFYRANGFNPLFDLKPQNYEHNMVYMIKNLLP